MRRSIIFAGLLILLLSFCGCTKQDEPHLDMSNYGEEFRAENENLFPNTSCEHSIVSEGVLIASSFDDSMLYHLSFCKYGNCDYEEHYEPHVLVWELDHDGSGIATYAENGYLYHALYKSCIKCFSSLAIYIYCEKQDPNCGKGVDTISGYTECLASDRDWEKIFKDFPYIIEIRD